MICCCSCENGILNYIQNPQNIVIIEGDKAKFNEVFYNIADTRFGKVSLVWDNEGLIYLGFPDNQEDPLKDFGLRFTFNKATESPLGNIFSLEWLRIHLIGTEFQRRVWKQLLKIKAGSTVSYKDIAIECGIEKGSRAIGNAVGANPISLIIPCHRVLRTDGSIGGYYWGIDVKKKILQWESGLR